MKILLEKYFSKRTIRLLTILAATIILITYFTANLILRSLFNHYGLDAIKYLSYLLLILYIIFALITAVVIYYTYRIHFKNNDKSDLSIIITFGIYCVFALVLLLNLQTIRFFFKLSSMNLGMLFGFNENTLTFSINLLKVIAIPLIGIAIYNGYLLVKKSPDIVIEIDIENRVSPFITKFKSFISSKHGKIITGCIVTIAFVVIVVLNILSNHKTTIDLTKGVVVEFSGVDGAGFARVVDNKWNYDGDLQDVDTFLNSVDFYLEEDDNLSNGDEITVSAKYSDEMADEYKVNPTNTTIKIKVKGLDIEFDSYNDLSKKEKKLVEDAWDEYFEENFNDEVKERLLFYDNLTLSEQKVVARYYGNCENVGEDTLVYIVKVNARGNYLYQEETENFTKYYKIEVNEITPSNLKDLEASSFNLSYRSILEANSDEKAIREVLKEYEEYIWSTYEMIEIK